MDKRLTREAKTIAFNFRVSPAVRYSLFLSYISFRRTKYVQTTTALRENTIATALFVSKASLERGSREKGCRESIIRYKRVVSVFYRAE